MLWLGAPVPISCGGHVGPSRYSRSNPVACKEASFQGIVGLTYISWKAGGGRGQALTKRVLTCSH